MLFYIDVVDTVIRTIPSGSPRHHKRTYLFLQKLQSLQGNNFWLLQVFGFRSTPRVAWQSIARALFLITVTTK